MEAGLLSVMTLFRKTVYFHLVAYLDGLGSALFFIVLLHLFVCMCMCVGTLEVRGQLCCHVYPRAQTHFRHLANLSPLAGLKGSSFMLFVVFCFALLLQCWGLNS